MKKMMIMAMAVVMMMFASSNAYAREIGEYEKNMILNGKFEVVDLNKKASLSEWTDPDLFGNQYRLYTYKTGDTEEIVCLKHHCDRQEARQIKAASKK